MTEPGKPNAPDAATESVAQSLRRRAEASFHESESRLPDNVETLAPEVIRQTFRELRVHQIELEMQNEELRRTKTELAASRARFFDLYDLAPVGYLRVSAAGVILQANLTVATLLGVTRETLVKLALSGFICDEGQNAYYLHLKQLVEGGARVAWESRMLKKEGGSFWALLEATTIQDADGAPELRIVLSDISKRKRDLRELQLASTVYQSIGEGVMVADANNHIVLVNPAFTQITGYTEAEALGQTTQLLSSDRQAPAFYRDLWHSLNGTGQWQGEIWNRRKDGTEYLEWLMINTIYAEDGSVQQRVGLFSDITDQKLAQQTIWEQANYDPLTGLPNRNMFHDRLEQGVKIADRSGLSLALLFLDLDRFKEVNDTLGHDQGDVLLKMVAEQLCACVRETDTVARMGGDEFTIILGEIVRTDIVERVANRCLDSLCKPLQLGEERVNLSISIGITLYPNDTTDPAQITKYADQAMYAAKQGGRNRFQYFTPALQEAAEHRRRLTQDLRSAQAEQQFQVHYQPIVELTTGAVRKAEALIRWQHPTRGAVSPIDFIPFAEDTGLIHSIGDWVFREAVQQVARWRAAYDENFQVSVNKSPAQFHGDDHHDSWFERLQELGLPGQCLVVEITEGLLLAADQQTEQRLLQFSSSGVQVAIDDFGTGYSALSYLKKFDIDFLKIDQSFTRDLAPESDNMALCEAIIVMSHKLGLRVIAEGIETQEQHDLLLAAGCDFGQGYLYARPMAADDFALWMEDSSRAWPHRNPVCQNL